MNMVREASYCVDEDLLFPGVLLDVIEKHSSDTVVEVRLPVLRRPDEVDPNFNPRHMLNFRTPSWGAGYE